MPASTARTHGDARRISKAVNRPSTIVRVTQTTVNSTVRATTVQKNSSPRIVRNCRSPAQGGVAPLNNSLRVMSWKARVVMSTSG
ncbi:hypothetical protein [Streptomyces sp. CB01580]|uniref:hypothetical protein n=1 Tax=Streptomyces sp. CB01580 TaxID=1703933 RepID=UPI001F5B2F36|nr:hypothetical protein [Streptomyces sp. CB01580]